ncbi:MAG TPA: SPOR domain-containing protein [Rhodanobacteraceae bacterium]|nr:SPOR domain-containing protein [Rhodanobacteraceae bacterium]
MAARKGRQATRGGSKSWPAWIWVGIGLVLGVGLMLLVLGKDWAPLLRKRNLPQPNPAATAPPASEPAVADSGKPKEPPKKTYDFYKVLEANEVVIPDAELSAKARAEQQAKSTPNATTAPPTTGAATTAGARYILQAGSYPDAKGADEIKAKLALLGYVAQVQPVTVNGRAWHRVRLGPYASASDLEAAKRTLGENGINAIALKETPSP